MSFLDLIKFDHKYIPTTMQHHTFCSLHATTCVEHDHYLKERDMHKEEFENIAFEQLIMFLKSKITKDDLKRFCLLYGLEAKEKYFKPYRYQSMKVSPETLQYFGDHEQANCHFALVELGLKKHNPDVCIGFDLNERLSKTTVRIEDYEAIEDYIERLEMAVSHYYDISNGRESSLNIKETKQ